MRAGQLKLRVDTGHLPTCKIFSGSSFRRSGRRPPFCQRLPRLLKLIPKKPPAAASPAAAVVTLTYQAGFVKPKKKGPKRWRVAEKSERIEPNHPGSSYKYSGPSINEEETQRMCQQR